MVGPTLTNFIPSLLWATPATVEARHEVGHTEAAAPHPRLAAGSFPMDLRKQVAMVDAAAIPHLKDVNFYSKSDG
jgi:hypothetical protein